MVQIHSPRPFFLFQGDARYGNAWGSDHKCAQSSADTSLADQRKAEKQPQDPGSKKLNLAHPPSWLE